MLAYFHTMQENTATQNITGFYSYDVHAMMKELALAIKQYMPAESWTWLQDKVASVDNKAQFNLTFAAIPRKTGKASIYLNNIQAIELKRLRSGFSIEGWTADRLCRVWLLLHVNASDKESYILTLEELFLTADMNEQAALYSALPLLAYPEQWQMRCAEGIRSNIGDVLQAIMCNNPYPAEHLEQPAWNQMVLKAFFTGKPVQQMVGLDERSNKELAHILSDYAHERWAAQRTVTPLLWRCVAPFVDEEIFPDIKRIAGSENNEERMAAVLVCRETEYPPAKDLLNNDPFLRLQADDPDLSWETLAQKMHAD